MCIECRTCWTSYLRTMKWSRRDIDSSCSCFKPQVLFHPKSKSSLSGPQLFGRLDSYETQSGLLRMVAWGARLRPSLCYCSDGDSNTGLEGACGPNCFGVLRCRLDRWAKETRARVPVATGLLA